MGDGPVLSYCDCVVVGDWEYDCGGRSRSRCFGDGGVDVTRRDDGCGGYCYFAKSGIAGMTVHAEVLYCFISI